VSIGGSAAPLVSALEALRILAIVVMFAVLEQVMANRTAMKRFLTAAFVSLIFPLVYTVVLLGIGTSPSEVKGSFTRITGPFSQSNTFGRYLMLMIIFGVAILPHVQRRVRWPLGIALGLSSIFVVLTYTRTAVLGTAIGLVVVGCVLRSKKLLATLAIAGICALLVVPQFASRFTDLTAPSATPGDPTGNTLAWRIGYWGQVLPLANANPVTGIGLNMTQYQTNAAKQPHNDFIRAYVETGLLGLFAYVAFLVVLVRTGWNAVRGSPVGSSDRAVAAGALGCAVAFVAVSAFANVMSNVVSLWYLITFAAAAAVIERQYRTRTAPEVVPDAGN
jgi:O-antigen ligase